MGSVHIEGNEEESYASAMVLSGASVLPMVLRASIELNLLEIMARAGPNALLSPTEIASQLGTHNPDAPRVLDRLLRFLTCYSVLRCVADDAQGQRRYGLGPVCKFLTPNQDGASLAHLLLFVQDKVFTESWYHLKDAILEGGSSFNRAHGMTPFEYSSRDARFNSLLNLAMANPTTMTIKKMLETYKGFEGLKEVVDVGGGIGTALHMITSKYPHVKGINFDLPHVVADAPSYTGVEHVGGDMFVSIPRAEAIFLKWIIHDWGDDDCVKLLKKCFEALPVSGKVIIFESIVPEAPEDHSMSAKSVFWLDTFMLCQASGGKERTGKEFQALAKSAGFATCEIICPVYNKWVLEFIK